MPLITHVPARRNPVAETGGLGYQKAPVFGASMQSGATARDAARARPLASIAVLAIFGAVATAGCTRESSDERPPPPRSLLLVTLDTARADFVSPYGADPAVTPNLQRFAGEGTLFVNAWARTNVTNPSHLTILTGLGALRHGVFHNVAPFPAGVDTLQEAFFRAGYETAAFPSVPHVGESFGWPGFGVLEPARKELGAAEATDRFLSWLGKREGSKPFFAWLHYWDPHAPYTPPEEIARKFYDGDAFGGGHPIAAAPFFDLVGSGKMLREWLGERSDLEFPRAMYAGEMHYVDREIGRLFGHLEEAGIGEDLAVIVISDHGESLGEHDIFYDHPGLYEPQLRIPFLARIPGFPKGVRVDEPVVQEDVAPTIAELFGLSLGNEVEGLSLVRLLRGERDPAVAGREFLVHEHAHNLQVARREGRWKLVLPVVPRRFFGYTEAVLFDLESDPTESRNVAADHPGIVARLRTGLDRWVKLGSLERVKPPAERSPEEVERLKTLGYLQ